MLGKHLNTNQGTPGLASANKSSEIRVCWRTNGVANGEGGRHLLDVRKFQVTGDNEYGPASILTEVLL